MNTERARELRREATPPERAMWVLLKPLRQQGHHFRRQVPLGNYFADFVLHKAKLIIEVDGDSHTSGRGVLHDARRDAYLRECGFKILHIANTDVLTNPEGVYEQILSAVTKASKR